MSSVLNTVGRLVVATSYDRPHENRGHATGAGAPRLRRSQSGSSASRGRAIAQRVALAQLYRI